MLQANSNLIARLFVEKSHKREDGILIGYVSATVQAGFLKTVQSMQIEWEKN